MALTPRSVFRYFNVDGVPSSGKRKPPKSEIIQLLEQIFGVSRGGWVVAQTRAALNGVTPESPDDGGVVLNDANPANNGYYSRSGGAWVFGRGFPDTFARVALSGSGTAQSGAVNTGVNPASIEVFFAKVGVVNTGPLTLDGIGGEAARQVVNLAGNPLSAGEWTGMVMFFLNSTGQYQLLIDAGAAAAAAQSASAASGYADASEIFALEASTHATGAVDFVFLEGNDASLAKAVEDGTFVPIVDVVRRVTMERPGAAVQPFNVKCVATGQTSVPLPGDLQNDGSFGILGYRFRVIADGYQPEPGRDLSPAFIEQFMTGFYGRGMLTAETDGIATETAITATSAAGGATVTASVVTNFIPGGTIVIRHDNGRYWPYFVRSKAGSVLTLRPSLKWPVSTAGGGRVERLWYNRAHPGKFYMRHLAQRIALEPNYQSAMPDAGRLFYTRFKDHASLANDQMTVSGSATINYYPAANENGNGIDIPTEFVLDETAFVDFSAGGDAARSANFSVANAGDCILRFAFGYRNNNSTIIARVMDNNDRTCAQMTIPNYSSVEPMSVFTLPFRMVGNAASARVEFYVATLGSASSFSVGFIDVFSERADSAPLITAGSAPARVVTAGDSWASGDVANTPEREPIAYELARQLPRALVFNGGVGGFKVQDLNGQAFQDNVAAYSPTHVVISMGTNDAYSPSSGTFDPNAIDFFCADMQRLISMIQGIGAKPIILGPPALAEEDVGSGYSAWELNDRARKYARWLYDRLSSVRAASSYVGLVIDGAAMEVGSNANGTYYKYADGKMTCIREVSLSLASAGLHTFVPATPFLAGQPVSGGLTLKSASSGSSWKAIGTAALRMLNTDWNIYINDTVPGVSEEVTLWAEGRWKAP